MKYPNIVQFLIIVVGSTIFLTTTPKTNTSISFIKQSTEEVVSIQDLAQRIIILICLIPALFLIKNTIIRNKNSEKNLIIKNYSYLLLKLIGISIGYFLIWNIVHGVLFLCMC